MWFPRRPAVRIALSPRRLIVVRTPSIWPGGVAKYEHLDCAPIADAPLWKSPVQVLGEWLSTQHHKPSLHIVVSARFIRWQLVDSKPDLSHPKELAAYATYRFKETYGKLAEDWQLLLSPQPPGHTVPVCAVDLALMDAVRQVCQDTDSSLVCVTPYFSAAFDRWSSTLKGNLRWFGVVEDDCIVLALHGPRGFVSLRTQRLDAPLAEVLPGLMAQMAIACGLPANESPIYLVGDGDPSPLALPSGVPVHWLRAKARRAPVPNQAGIRMALGL